MSIISIGILGKIHRNPQTNPLVDEIISFIVTFPGHARNFRTRKEPKNSRVCTKPFLPQTGLFQNSSFWLKTRHVCWLKSFSFCWSDPYFSKVESQCSYLVKSTCVPTYLYDKPGHHLVRCIETKHVPFRYEIKSSNVSCLVAIIYLERVGATLFRCSGGI